MSKRLLIQTLLLFLVSSPRLHADPVPSKLLPVYDYIRGTAGEPLLAGDTRVAGKFDLRVRNELRYCAYSAYRDQSGKTQDLDPIEYSRWTDLIGIDFGIHEDIEVGASIPLLWLYGKRRSPVSNTGIGDLLLRVRADPLDERIARLRTALGVGIKLPTGEYEYEILPTGTGTLDFSFVGYASWDLEILELYGAVGYVLTGRNEDYYGEQSRGDVGFCDIALGRVLFHSLSGIVEVNGHTMSPSRADDGFETDNGQQMLTLSPGILVSVPGVNLEIEAGLSYDLFGRSALRGATPLVRISINPGFER